MEFTVVTHHTDIHSGLKDMGILSIPEVLLVYTGCRDKQQFAESIVHIAFAHEHIEQLKQHKYCSANGSFVFRYPASYKTAVMYTCSEKILLKTGDVYCINKIHNIEVQHDDEICTFLGVLESKVRLGIVKWAKVSRNDSKYYAIPSANLTLTSTIKSQLKFLECEVGINVVYKETEGTQTHRSLLLPTTLISTDEILHNGLYSIVSMKPRPTLHLTSSAHEEVFGVQAIPEGQPRDFETYYTPCGMERINTLIIPRMRQMEPGEEFCAVINFATPKGIMLVDTRILSIARSCLAVTFVARKDETKRSTRRSRL